MYSLHGARVKFTRSFFAAMLYDGMKPLVAEELRFRAPQSGLGPIIAMTPTLNWNDLEGASVAGRYWLKQCLISSPDDAWYLIRFDATRDAAIRLLRADLPSAGAQLDTWRELRALDHPHIVRMFDAGRAEVEGAEVIYAVCEYPDDFLAAALSARPLSPSEASEILRACVSALGHLHANGYAHGAIDPQHIMAFGDRIKLPSDPVRRAGALAPDPEPAPSDAPEVVAGGHPTPASDVWALGMTLIEILTRTRPVLGPADEVPFLPEPFGTIARNALRREPAMRWSVSDIEEHLNPKPVIAPPAPEPVPEPICAPVPEPIAAPEAVSTPRPEPEPERIAPRPVLPPPVRRAEPPEPPGPVSTGLPLKWVPVAGLVAAAALGAIFLRHPASEPAPGPPKQAPVHSAPRPEPVRPSPAAPAPIQSRPVEAQPSSGSAVWRVVAYEYHKRAQAEAKARAINAKHPGWHAEVFAPKGSRAPYFVALGGYMSLSQAQQVRREARAKGAPRDTFVRNYPR